MKKALTLQKKMMKASEGETELLKAEGRRKEEEADELKTQNCVLALRVRDLESNKFHYEYN